jgi:hypothetical protein
MSGRFAHGSLRASGLGQVIANGLEKIIAIALFQHKLHSCLLKR